MKMVNLLGTTFGRLEVKERLGSRLMGRTGVHYLVFWRCQCQCGNSVELSTGQLNSGNTRSCGCLRREVLSKIRTRHGNAYNKKSGKSTSEYQAWQHMHGACRNFSHTDYTIAGAKGLKVCERWSGNDGFMNFLGDVGNRPSKFHSFRRIDKSKGFDADNCKWMTRQEMATLNNTLPDGRIMRPTGKGVSKSWIRIAWKMQYDRQEGLCSLCLKPILPVISKCCWDHDHKTGVFRDILHQACNHIVGMFESYPKESMAVKYYLSKHARKKEIGI